MFYEGGAEVNSEIFEQIGGRRSLGASKTGFFTSPLSELLAV